LPTAYLRDPVGPQILASEAKQYRSRLLRRLRLLATDVPPALSEGAARHCRGQGGGQTDGLVAAPSPIPDRNDETLRGRGIAYTQRSGTVVAIVAEVKIDPHPGKV